MATAPVLRRPAARFPLALFTVVVLLPALFLTIIGVQTLAKDRRLVEQQVRESLDRAAGRAVERLARELRRLDDDAARLASVEPFDASRLPADLRADLERAPDAAVVRMDGDSFRVLPAGRVPYDPRDVPVRPAGSDPVPAKLLAAEGFERQQKFQQATDLYREQLVRGEPASKALAMQRLARALANGGLREEALHTYEQLEREVSSSLGALPADLVGRYERCRLLEQEAGDRFTACALSFYSDLAGGRWSLEKARYIFYSERARAWVTGGRGPDPRVTRMIQSEAQHLAFADRVAPFIVQSRRHARRASGHRLVTESRFLIAWPASAADEARDTVLIVGEEYLKTRFWSRITAGTDDTDVSVFAPDGSTVFATARPRPPSGPETAGPSATATLQDTDFLWRVRVTPRRLDTLYADLNARRRLYVTMLVVMIAALTFAGYLVARTLRKDMEVARLKSEFVATVSHEFRSPLTGISQLSELLVGGQVTSERRRQQYYEMIHGETRRLARLVDNVLDFARMEEGRKQYQQRRIETSGWLDQVAKDFERALAANGKRVATTIAGDLPAVDADPHALGGAIENLLDNAVKYSPGSDTVWLDAGVDGDEAVVIQVRDCGVGIPASEQPHVFERFFRGRAMADVVKGTGLGLSLVQHVVAAHGGTISFNSVPGQGTTFTVRLPVPGTSSSVARRATASEGSR